MKVTDGEGVANRTGPESCVYIRKGMSEALTGGERAGIDSRLQIDFSVASFSNIHLLDKVKPFLPIVELVKNFSKSIMLLFLSHILFL